MRIAPSIVAAGLFAAAFGAAPASADSLTAPVAAFDKVTLENVGGAIVAHRGGVSIKIIDEREMVAPPVADAKARKLTLKLETLCGGAETRVIGFDEVLSKLENVAAYRLHRQKKYADSKAGFAKALALDPKNRIAAINLASAQQLLGEKDAAVATLDPWLKSAPVETYAAIAQDPELAPLLPNATLVAMKAKVAGNAVVTKGKFEGAAYSAEKGLLAVERRECGWGMDGDKFCHVAIELFDGKGAMQGAIVLGEFDQDNTALMTARAKGAQQALRDMGFKTEKVVVGVGTEGKWKFPGLKIGMAESADRSTANILHKDTELGHADILMHVRSALYAPTAKEMVVISSRPGHEGCEGTDPTLAVAVPITLP